MRPLFPSLARATALAIPMLATLTGCSEIIGPGHAGMLFTPANGLQHEILGPGRHSTGATGHIEDFDVTYSTKHEQVKTNSNEGLTMDLKLAIIFRPVQAELYQLDTEIGQNYYDEVVGPEFRSAARGVFARHSYAELQRASEKIEDEIEAEVRRRIHGKHIEISSITMEAIEYAPEIAAAVRSKLIGEQEALRQKAALENEALRQKLDLEHQAVSAKLRAEAALREKQNEHLLITEQAGIEKLQAETDASTRITKAKAEAEERTLLAKAAEAEKKAEARSINQFTVMMHAYDALGKLGGEGTTIWLGDWSRVPQFLFPHGALNGPMGLNPPPQNKPARFDPPPAADAYPAKPAKAPVRREAPAGRDIPARTVSPQADDLYGGRK